MSAFIIEFEPKIAKAPNSLVVPSFTEIDINRILDAIPEEYDVIYHLGNSKYGYYPSSIITLLNDIQLEWELVSKRLSHNMTLSGYAVLGIAFRGESAYFHNLMVGGTGGDAIGGAVSANIIEQIFKSALDSIWYLIERRTLSL